MLPIPVRALALLAATLVPALAAHGASPGSAGDPLTEQTVIGTVGKDPVTYGDVVAHDRDAFEQLEGEHARRLHQLELDYAQAYHDVAQKQLDTVLDRRALEIEAAARHKSREAILAQLKVAPVTDKEELAYYNAHKGSSDHTFAQVAAAIQDYLANRHREEATRAFYDGLRVKHHITAALPPYRIAVAAVGPVRGKAAAAVTIVEFADFQCPFCQRAESTLQSVIAKHPDDVRLVFRNLPLSELHPNATVAAQAAVCADRQGRFWEMHDAMFDNQAALGTDALKATAMRLGLDMTQFANCLDDNRDTAQVLGADARAAADLGIDSTPYFFIDGRPVRGLVPEQLEKIIAEELRQTHTDRGG